MVGRRILVAASTHAGVTTRLKPHKARQVKLASLVLLVACSQKLKRASWAMENGLGDQFESQIWAESHPFTLPTKCR